MTVWESADIMYQRHRYREVADQASLSRVSPPCSIVDTTGKLAGHPASVDRLTEAEMRDLPEWFEVRRAALGSEGEYCVGTDRVFVCAAYACHTDITLQFINTPKEHYVMAAFDGDNRQIMQATRVSPSAANAVFCSEGDFLGNLSHPHNVTQQDLFKFPPHFEIRNVILDAEGRFSLLGQIAISDGNFADESGVTLFVENDYPSAVIARAITATGYPLRCQSGQGDIAANTVFDLRGRHWGELQQAHTVSKTELNRFPDSFEVWNVLLDPQGRFYIDGRLAFVANEPAKNTGFKLRIRKSGQQYYVIEAFDGRGERVLNDETDVFESDSSPEFTHQVSELISAKDIQVIFDTLGYDSTVRILAQFVQRDIGSIRNALKQSLRVNASSALLSEVNVRSDAAPRKLCFSSIRALDFSRFENVHLEDIMTEEIKRTAYGNIKEDHTYINRILVESNNSELPGFIRRVYAKVYEYFHTHASTDYDYVNATAARLMFYQKVGIQFFMEKERAIFGDEPGVGKTLPSVIAALNILDKTDVGRCLIVAPKQSIHDVWEKEIRTKSIGNHPIWIPRHSHFSGGGKTPEQYAASAKFVLINYEKLSDQGDNESRYFQFLRRIHFDVIVLDEGHRLRNDTLFFHSIFKLEAKFKLLLSGSPLVGASIEQLFNLLRWLHPERFTNRRQFNQYFGGTHGTARLRAYLSGIMIRRLAKDVLDLPESQSMMVPVRLRGKHKKVYQLLYRSFVNYSEQCKVTSSYKTEANLLQFGQLRLAAVDTGLVNGVITLSHQGVERAVGLLIHKRLLIEGQWLDIRTDQQSGQVVSLVGEGDTTYPVVHRGKKQQVRFLGTTYDLDHVDLRSMSNTYQMLDQYVEKAASSAEKSVIFCRSRKMVFALAERYQSLGVSLLVGGMSTSRANDQLSAFRNTGNCSLLLSTYQAGSESLDFSCARNVFCVEQAQTHASRVQTIRRALRFGQQKVVRIYHMIVQDTLYEKIEMALADQQTLYGEVLGDAGDPIENADFLQSLFDELPQAESIVNKHQTMNEEPTVIARPIIGDGSIYCTDTCLQAHLELKDETLVNCLGFDQILNHSANLSEASKAKLAHFVYQQVCFDIEHDLPVKRRLLWQLWLSLDSTLHNVDYHGEIEPVVDNASMVVKKLIEDPTVEYSHLAAGLNDNALRLLNTTLHEMELNNVFKVLSVMGIVDKQYYFTGKLLEYPSPISIAIKDSRIQYVDDGMVDRLAPNRVLSSIEFTHRSSYVERAKYYRDLHRPEEISLAREAHKGNVSASTALSNAFSKQLVRWVFTLLKNFRLNRRNQPRLMWIATAVSKFTRDDKDEMLSEGQTTLLEIIRSYYPEASVQSLAEYANPLVMKAVKQCLYRIARRNYEEHMSYDQIAPVAPAQSKLIEAAQLILTKANFGHQEVDIFMQHAIDGEIHDPHQFTHFQVDSILKEAKTLLQAKLDPY
jgi:SNF2 family DNA or RNA helicase